MPCMLSWPFTGSRKEVRLVQAGEGVSSSGTMPTPQKVVKPVTSLQRAAHALQYLKLMHIDIQRVCMRYTGLVRGLCAGRLNVML